MALSDAPKLRRVSHLCFKFKASSDEVRVLSQFVYIIGI